MRMWVLLTLLVCAAPTGAQDGHQGARPDDVGVLIQALKDRNLQVGAAAAIARIGKPAVPALQRALADEDATLRLWAAFALGGIGADARDAVPALMRQAADSDHALRAVAVEALGKIGPAASAAVPVLIKALKDPEPRVRTWSAVALGRIKPDGEEDIRALIEAFHDEPVRKAAVEAVVQIGKPALPVLIDALTDNDRRLDVAEALRRIDPQAASRAGVDQTTAADLPALVRVFSNKERSEEARRAAVAAVGQLGRAAEPALDSLISALADLAIRPTVALALGKVGKPAVPALAAKLKDGDAGVRASAAAALGHVGSDARDATPTLVEALQDRDREVRRAAGQALEAIGPDTDKAVPALIAVLRSNDAEPVRQAAIKALVRASPEAKPAIVAAFLATIKENNNYGVRMLAEWGLKKIDPAAADKAGVR